MKRLLSYIIVLCIVLSLCTIATFAADSGDITVSVNEGTIITPKILKTYPYNTIKTLSFISFYYMSNTADDEYDTVEIYINGSDVPAASGTGHCSKYYSEVTYFSGLIAWCMSDGYGDERAVLRLTD